MILFHNCKIQTAENQIATAMVIDHGCFVQIGSEKDLLNSFPKNNRKVNLQGKTIWPGLIDAHVHLCHLADSMTIVNCETKSLEDCLNRIEQSTQQGVQSDWIRGHGWNQNIWVAGFGHARQLDKITAGRPAYLTAKSLHAAWVNSKALSLAGIDSQTPDPPGGVIQRDGSGQPTGILFEAGAMQLVESIIPKDSGAEVTRKLKALIPQLWQLGLIGVHDFDGLDCWKALQECNQNHELNFRVSKNIPFDQLDSFIQAGLVSYYGDDFLHIGHVKLFADGALGPQTAAMKKPYEGSEETGTLLLTEDEILDIGQYAVSHGIGLAIHAIGDLAIYTVLNAYARLRNFEEEKKLPHYQHRIEHVQIIDPHDLTRLAQFGIVASVQPIHAPSDMKMADKYLDKRSKFAYAYQSLLKSGAELVLGSDAPVEPVNPFQGIHAAVTRKNIQNMPEPEGWHPEQSLSLSQALEGFSQKPAEIVKRGHKFGKIAEGFKADFLILRENPFTLNPTLLHQIRPLATFIQGECVYQSKEWENST